jgi:hypothetical protein
MTCKAVAVVKLNGDLRHFSNKEGFNCPQPDEVRDLMTTFMMGEDPQEVCVRLDFDDTLMDIMVGGLSLGFYTVCTMAQISGLKHPELVQTVRDVSVICYDMNTLYALPLFGGAE